MTEIKLLLFFLAFVMVSCGGEPEKKDDAGSVSLKGARFLCLEDKEAKKFYVGAKILSGRFVRGEESYDTKEDCEKVIAKGSKYVNK